MKGRLCSLEFFLYYSISLLGYAIITYICVTQSQDALNYDPNIISHRIVPGWFLDRHIDLSDDQWKTWRSNFPFLALVMAAFIILSQFVKMNANLMLPSHQKSSWRKEDVTIIFYNLISVIAVFYMHGWDVIFLYVIATVNFLISRIFKSFKLNPIISWIFNLSVLFTADKFNGYRGTFEYLGIPTLESHGILRWNIYFKITMLRQIAFNLDYYWMLNNRPVFNLKSKLNQLAEQHQSRDLYNIWNYFAYVFYLPLFIAGPVMNFNSFISQIYERSQLPEISTHFKLKGVFQVVTYTLGLEIFLHFFYQYSFSENSTWKFREFSASQLCCMAYVTLNFMYLKFLIIWRFFRLISILDDVEPPENMIRCVNNNFTFSGFWRSWHASLNKWIVRYVFVPLGGSKMKAVNVWVIFIFIGLWHDLQVRWLAWAILNCVFFVGEISVTQFYKAKMSWLSQKWWFRHVVGIVGVFDISMLMLANLAILYGWSGSYLFISTVLASEGAARTIIFAFIWLYCKIMMMQEIRENEAQGEETRKRELSR
eukprot:TRINITY_DN7939_c2_g1_i2.p1 TRINITY_DN7939_c2_g1~~TRINITY_DN7939_c2_g1_i2.p1  ORF type:complete len:539 (+),score=167.65 TRINITY_DN7939_c2_g1_i2:202-1818(+)